MWPYLCPADAQISCHAFSLLFFPAISPSDSLSFSLSRSPFHSFFLPLFPGVPGQLHETLHSLFFLSIIHHSAQLLRPVVHEPPNAHRLPRHRHRQLGQLQRQFPCASTRDHYTPPTPHLNDSSCAQSAHRSVQINANTSYIHCIFIIYCKPL